MEILNNYHLKRIVNTNGGLEWTPKDTQDFDYWETFGGILDLGLPDVKKLPKDGIGRNVFYKHNQLRSDLCTGFSVVQASEPQERVRLSPEYQFAMGKYIRSLKTGNPNQWKTWGNDIHSPMNATIKFGSLKYEDSKEMTLEKKSRDFLANWNNWEQFHGKAKVHKKVSYFKIRNHPFLGYDKFDAIRAALWQNKDADRIIITGGYWKGSWNNPPNGLIPYSDIIGGTGHLFIIVDFGTVLDKAVLKIYFNYGANVGKNGYVYMDRKTANKQLIFGSYMFVDIDVDIAKVLRTYNNKAVSSKGERPQIYYITGGKKRLIRSQNVLNALNFEDKEGVNGWVYAPDYDLDAIPDGEPIKNSDLTAPLQQLFRRNSIS